jgi:hypothetical protein
MLVSCKHIGLPVNLDQKKTEMVKNVHLQLSCTSVQSFFLEGEGCLHEADVVFWAHISISDLIVCQINHTQLRTDVTCHTYCPIECIIS